MSTMLLMAHAFFMNTNHPLMMMIIILPTTILYATILTKMIKSSWLSMILILILIGAMLILFMYMASLSPNEIMTIPFLSLPLFFLLYFTSPIKNNQEIYSTANHSMKMFYQIQGITTTLLVTYLLLTMLIIINITNKNEGPLRATYD